MRRSNLIFQDGLKCYLIEKHLSKAEVISTKNKNMNKLIACFLMTISVGLFAENKTSHLETIVLGSGCFWGAEKGYESLVGVYDAVSGYSDGYGIRPSYREITKFKNKFNDNNYAEVVEVTFNRQVVSLESILQYFYEQHDPTQLNRQGNDIGTQYRSIILYNDESQRETITKVTNEFQELLLTAGYGKIQTQLILDEEVHL